MREHLDVEDLRKAIQTFPSSADCLDHGTLTSVRRFDVDGQGKPSRETSLDVQAEYARLSALVHLRMVELLDALEQHESERCNWTRSRTMRLVERLLG